MSVQTEINRINNEVTSQADLIAQIQTALDGKAGGGKKTVTITVNAIGSPGIFYIDSSGNNASSSQSGTYQIEAYGGVIYCSAVGSYENCVQIQNYPAYVALNDNATITAQLGGGGSD